jgi:hypothetical protein
MALAETPPVRAGDSLEEQEIPKAEAETARAASAKVKMAKGAKADAAGSVDAASSYLQALRTPSAKEWLEASRRPT